MSVYAILADVYVNNTHIGKKTLKIPKYTFRNFENGFESFPQATDFANCTGCTTFSGGFFEHPMIAPMDNTSIFNNYNISGNINVFEYAKNNDEIYFVFGPRKIKINFWSVRDTNIDKQFGITYNFILNGNTILSIGNPYCGGWYDTTGFPNYFKENIQTIPWINPDKNHFGNYIFGCYQRYTVPGTKPTIYPDQCNVNYNEDSYVNQFLTWLGDYEPEESDDNNPYDELVSTINQGGEDTNFTDDSDDVTLDNLPTIDAIGTGFATIFTPTKSQLRALADIFWNANIFSALQNLVENINNMFTSLAMVPFTVTSGRTVDVTWLGLFDTGVSLTLASKQYYEFDMGSINLNNDDRIFKYDNCLDYSPFSKLGIYLPFIGFEDLDVDECRNSILHLKYRIDILSGSCVAIIEVSGKAIYQFTGNCLTQIPITNESMQSLVQDAVNVGIAASSARVAGAASAADISAAESSEKMSNAQKEAHRMHAEVTRTNADNNLRSATANAAMGLKPQFNKSGSVSASASMLSVKQPYLFLTTSRLSIPKYYEHYAGFPSNITDTLSTFSGYTVVESIRLNDLVATSPEIEEIYQLLKSGVII